MNQNSKLNQIILRATYVFIMVLMMAVIALLILKYEVEGEQNMPFRLSSMIVISNAEGYQEEQSTDYRWDVEVYQNNDIYFNIEKNKNNKEEEAIQKIVIDNIQILKQPKIGNIEIYRPSNDEIQTFQYTKEYEVKDSIEFAGETEADIKNLKISNQGGTIILRVLNKTGKRYTSNGETFEHDGKLLDKIEVSYDDIKTTISFDVTIFLESGISFKGTITLELPVGDIMQNGSAHLEMNNTKSVVFKRN